MCFFKSCFYVIKTKPGTPGTLPGTPGTAPGTLGTAPGTLLDMARVPRVRFWTLGYDSGYAGYGSGYASGHGSGTPGTAPDRLGTLPCTARVSACWDLSRFERV